MWRKLPLLLGLISFSLTAHASPELKAGKQSLRLSNWQTDVKVVGNLAVTTMTMDFYNDTHRVLEGQLTFPLGEGQTVSGYAMDVNGTMRPAVVVEKDKGRQVFEKIVRRGIDPGLVEKTSGNNFRTRVYPIPAKGNKRIRVTFEEILDEADNTLRYRLPLDLKAPVDQFGITATVVKRTIAPQVDPAGIALTFDKVTENFVARFNRKNYQPKGGLNFSLPLGKRTETYVEDGQHWQDLIEVTNTYFLTRVPLNVKAAAKTAPTSIDLYWDVSGSGQGIDRKRTYIALQSYLSKNNARVTVHTFANALIDSKTFKAGQTTALVQYLNSQRYDGGTQIGTLDFSTSQADEIILVTDGISNLGKSEPTIGKAPVYVINSATTAEHTRLKSIAEASGGAYLNMNKLDVKAALALLSQQSIVMQKISVLRGEIKHVYPSRAVTINPAQRTNIVGKLVSDQAEIEINFTRGGKTIATKRIILTRSKDNTGLIARIWAQLKLAELELQPQQNEADIVLLGKDYGLVTQFTSLIVLDRLQDYVENDIMPPRELASMRTQYFAQKKARAVTAATTQTSHLKQVAAWWKEEQRWWDTNFKVRATKARKEKSDRSIGGQTNLDQLPADIPQNAPAPSSSTQQSFDDDESSETMANEPVIAANERTERPQEEERNRITTGADISRTKTNGVSETEAEADIETKQTKRAPHNPSKKIRLAKWDPKTPYLAQLKKAKQPYKRYLQLRRQHSKSSAFFLDVADFFKEQKQPKIALRVLSNIAEMDLDNPQLLRILGHRLAQLEQYPLALSVFEQVLSLRPEEPQSYRDLALVAAKTGQLDRARDMLWHVVKNPWGRFAKIEIIALVELNRLFAQHPNLARTGISEDLVQAMPLDVRIVMTWDADATDIDLWVTGPYGEKCYYGHPNTRIGGRMSRDFTQGYGPETFRLKRAPKGQYRIQANYYGNRQQHLSGATTLQVEIITDFGKTTEKREQVTLRLKDSKEVIDVGTIELGQ